MSATRSMGTSLTLVAEGSEEDLVIGKIASIGDISTDTDEIETTTLDSPNRAKEFMQGAKDSGSFDVELNNVFDGTVETLNSVFDSGDSRSWTIKWLDNDDATAATLDFDAFLKTRAFNQATTDGLNKVTFTLRVTGDPTYQEGSSS